MNKKKNKKNKEQNKDISAYYDSAYETLALADSDIKNKNTKTTIPSIEAVIDTRKWSEENKK